MRQVLALLLGVALLAVGLLLWRAFTQADEPPFILYLAEDAQAVTQLFRTTLDGTAVTQLTTSPHHVTAYAPAPDGRTIVYLTTPQAAGQQTLWLTDRNGRSHRALLRCSDALCDNPTWAPDSRRLIYERRALDTSGIPSQPQLWWLDVLSRESVPVLVDGRAATNPRLSPDMQWIAYHSPLDEGIWLYNFVDGRSHLLASEPGMPVAWHADSHSLVYSAFNSVDWAVSADEHSDEEHRHVNMAVHLFVYHIPQQRSQQLSAPVVIEDSAPAWSPDGKWIAFGRRQVRTNASRQLWLTAADGAEARPLTDDPALTVGPPHWSPDGRYLLFQRFNMQEANAQPAIWLLELATGAQTQLAANAFLPTWLPQP